MRNITIIDYGCGNVLSLHRAIQEIGFKSLVTKEKSEISKSDLLILPGVGAFGNTMNFLKKYDLIDILIKCCDQKLKEIPIKWRNKKSLCVVVCSKGYPENFKKNIEIKNINKIQLNKDEYIFHAGTKIINGKVCAIGGRVLNFVN